MSARVPRCEPLPRRHDCGIPREAVEALEDELRDRAASDRVHSRSGGYGAGLLSAAQSLAALLATDREAADD